MSIVCRIDALGYNYRYFGEGGRIGGMGASGVVAFLSLAFYYGKKVV